MSFYTLAELLARHKEAFDDFDIRDIRYQQPCIFIEQEIKFILGDEGHKTQAEQFERLCFVVKYQKPQSTEFRRAFLAGLRVEEIGYEWIADALEKTIAHEDADGDRQIEEYRSALNRSDIPRTGDLYVYRLHLVSTALIVVCVFKDSQISFVFTVMELAVQGQETEARGVFNFDQ